MLSDGMSDFSQARKEHIPQEYLGFLLDDKINVPMIPFLTDIFRYLNLLNFKLQGKGQLVCELLSEVRIELFKRN